MARPAKSATRNPKLPARLPVKLPRLPKLPDPEEPDVFEEMTLLEHMEELRDRIVKAALAIGIASIAGWFLSEPLLLHMLHQAQVAGGKFPTIGVGDPLTSSMKVALYIAIAITLPILIYQCIAFLAPGLTNREKRVLYLSLPFVSLLFMSGAAFGFFLAAPRAFTFMAHFRENIYTPTPTAESATTFFLTLMFGLGIAFQLPVVLLVLAKLNIVSPRRLAENRKYAAILILVAAAIITPTADPFNLAFIAVPLFVLYELGLLLARLLVRPRSATSDRASAGRHLALIVLPMYLLYRVGLWLGRVFARPRPSAYEQLAVARPTDG